MTATTAAPGVTPGGDAPGPRPAWWRRGGDWVTVVVPALVIFVPLALTAPGQVGADTKSYLYLDPGRLLGDAPYIWHDHIGLGTVTHQNIGYLFPAGPFYWLAGAAGLPDWLAQRLWLGGILFGAALGVRYLLRTIGWADGAYLRGPVLVASLGYALSPYFLAYAARISVSLLPWAALPWLIALTARAVRGGGWRYPAWFAFVVLVVGGVNATALILVGLGPLAWLVYAVAIERDATVRQALAAGARIFVLTGVTSVWWVAGLVTQGAHGLPVLRYTETFKTVAESSTAPEVFRGLGYWFFYGNDKLGPWIEPSEAYTQRLGLLVLSYALPLGALAALALVRWRHRGFFAVLIGVGGLVAVGGHPWGGPSLLGGAFTLATRSDAGLALRSTPRAAPLVALGTAVLLAAGVQALSARLAGRRPRMAVAVSVVAVVAVVANMPPLWTGQLVADNLRRDEALPGYWLDAIAAIDAGDPRYRVWEVPGSDFASYRWGNTVDPITPGLTDRSYVARELFQYGSAQSANLLNAIDRRMHEENLEPAAVAPVARLLGVDSLVVRSDLQYERYRLVRPRPLWDLLDRAPGLAGTATAQAFGAPVRNVAGPQQTMIDEIELAIDPDLTDPPPVAIIGVEEPLAMLRTKGARHPVLLAGDGEGVVDAAAAGVIDGSQVVLYPAWWNAVPDAEPGLDRVLDAGADLVVTDTNRRRAARWGTLRENSGYTERSGEDPVTYDPTDQRLAVFPGTGDDDATVTVVRARPGTVAATATATAWGNPVTLTPDDRPLAALDGNPATAWRVGAVTDPVGEELRIALGEPVEASSLTLLQPTTLSRNRWITEVELRFSLGGTPVATERVALDDRSRDPGGPGQVVEFPSRTFDALTLGVAATNTGKRPRYDGQSGVGFAEVAIPGVGTEELVRPPVDLVRSVRGRAVDHRIIYVLTRLRSNPAEPVRGDPEVAMARLVEVPGERSYSITGTARLSAFVPDDAIDALLGATGPTVRSSERLPGALGRRAAAAFDGDRSTHWTSPFEQRDTEVWVEATSDDAVTATEVTLEVVADGRHSVPTRVRIEAGGATGPLEVVGAADVDPVAPDSREYATATVTVPLEGPVTANRFRVVVEEVRPTETLDWFSDAPVLMPVAIANVDIGDLDPLEVPATIDTGCRDDLVAVDGAGVAVRVTGTTDDAVARRGLAVVGCGDVDLGDAPAGVSEVVLTTTDGATSGIDIDQLTLASDAGGGALSPTALPRSVPPGPPVTLDASGRVRTEATVAVTDGEPFWLVEAQSWSSGFSATVGGIAQGEPVVVDGFANGWLVDPATLPTTGNEVAPAGVSAGAREVPVVIEWEPQRLVWAGLAISAVGAVAMLVAMITARRTRRRQTPWRSPGLPWDPAIDWPPASAAVRAGTATLTGVAVRTTGAVVGGSALAVVAAANLPGAWWPLGVLIGAVGGLALGSVRWRNAPAALAFGALGLAAAYIVTQQLRNAYPSDFTWAGEFTRVHVLGVVALVATGVAGIRDLTERRRLDTPVDHPRTNPDDMPEEQPEP